MKDALLNHYRELVRAYFADTTEEGMISKYAKIRECEDIIVGIIGGLRRRLTGFTRTNTGTGVLLTRIRHWAENPEKDKSTSRPPTGRALPKD